MSQARLKFSSEIENFKQDSSSDPYGRVPSKHIREKHFCLSKFRAELIRRSSCLNLYFGAGQIISWGRTQMGSDGLNRFLTGYYFVSPVGVRLVSLKTDDFWGTGGILFREYCFGEENSLSSAANSVSSARNSVSSRLHTNNRPKGTH